MKEILLIGFGGFIGSVARFYVSKLNLAVDFLSIPIGTLTVNILGSFLLGILTGIAEKSILMNLELRLFLMIGLCGGFTTFSSFSYETVVLLRGARYAAAVCNVTVQLAGGLCAVILGMVAARAVP